MSNLIDILLKPFLLQVKSYVKDNLHFLSRCSRENYEDTLLVKFDAVNLCTKIPHTFGLEALDYWLENHLESLHARFNKEFVLYYYKIIIWNSIMNFITILKVQQWIQSSLQLTQLYRWDILKSNFIVSALLIWGTFSWTY